MVSVNGRAPGFGEHKGHQVHPHNHAGQDHELFRCSGKWLCQSPSCVDKDGAPRGTWFDGPRCPRPARAAKEATQP